MEATRRDDAPGNAARVRKPAGDEAGAIAELLNDHAQELHGEALATPEEVAHWARLPGVELWVAQDPRGRLAAYADAREEAERTRYWLYLCEHPRRRGLGGAAALLGAAEEWALRSAAPGALLRGVVTLPDEPLSAVYEAAGYRTIRHTLEMRAELGVDLPGPEWPEGLAVRTFVPGEDERRVYEADMEAFEDHWEFVREPFAVWRTRMVEHPTFDPRLWFLLEEGDELAGICLCGIHTSGDPAFGWVTVLGVRRPWRRRGVGLCLLQHAFCEFRRRGMTRAGLDVDAENLTGAVRLYERVGMHVARRRDIVEKPLTVGS
ncbi:MAG: GNAT family N-acetyltransferase [Gaiellaceae bacterium]